MDAKLATTTRPVMLVMRKRVYTYIGTRVNAQIQNVMLKIVTIAPQMILARIVN